MDKSNLNVDTTQSTIISNFTYTMKQRYNSILPILGKAAVKVIDNLKGRGRNSWKVIIAHIELVNNSAIPEAAYYAALDQEIDLEEDYYSRDQFTQIVSDVRFKMSLPAFNERIGFHCEQELFKLFLWEDVFDMLPGRDGKERSTLVGYRPICRLKSD